MSFNPKRLLPFRYKRERCSKIVEDCTQMWNNKFPSLSQMLSILGYCSDSRSRDKIFSLLVKRMNETKGPGIMHGLKATACLLFLVTVRQKEALYLAQNFKSKIKANLNELKNVGTEKTAARIFSQIIRNLLLLLNDPEAHEAALRIVHSDILRCYDRIDMIKSASQGNVFFPEPYHDPKYLNWIYGTNLNLKEVLRSLASQSANCSPSTRKDSGPNALHFVPLSKDVNCRELSNYGMQNNNETTGGQNSISEPFQTIDGVYTRADRRSRTDRSCGISAGNNSFVNASAYRMEFNGDIGERSTFQSPKATDNCNKSGHKDDDLIEF